MKTAEKPVSIEERLKSRAFRDMLREHPIVKAKVERAKKDLALVEVNKNSPVSE